jgi:hypothetical protein
VGVAPSYPVARAIYEMPVHTRDITSSDAVQSGKYLPKFHRISICLEHGDSRFFRNISNDLPDYTASRHSSSRDLRDLGSHNRTLLNKIDEESSVGFEVLTAVVKKSPVFKDNVQNCDSSISIPASQTYRWH